jgi:hypothetical protein
VVDCTALLGTFASSLECFYNQSCLNDLLEAYPSGFNITILNRFFPSRFALNKTVKDLAEESFIENIVNDTIYSSYYRECSPIYCTYTFTERLDWIYAVSTLIALFGGLTAGTTNHNQGKGSTVHSIRPKIEGSFSRSPW